MQRAIRQAKIERERLMCEVQDLHGAKAGRGTERARGNKIIPDAILLDEDEDAYWMPLLISLASM
jgi:hypothetical protein